jgi:uncharacterized membrane protein YgcG
VAAGLAILGLVVLLTGRTDWPWWLAVGLGSPFGLLLVLDHHFRDGVGEFIDSTFLGGDGNGDGGDNLGGGDFGGGDSGGGGDGG